MNIGPTLLTIVLKEKKNNQIGIEMEMNDKRNIHYSIWIFSILDLQNLKNKNHDFNFKNLHLFKFDFQIDISFCI